MYVYTYSLPRGSAAAVTRIDSSQAKILRAEFPGELPAFRKTSPFECEADRVKPINVHDAGAKHRR